eukprot:3402587-Pyramimonas_sp.AAC.1
MVKLGSASLFVEARIRRLKWLQQLLSNLSVADQVLGVVFGSIRASQKSQETVRDDNWKDANPWARQWLQDILGLEVYDDGEVFLDRYDRQPVRAILEGREDFIQLDLLGLRAHFVHNRRRFEPDRPERLEGGEYQCWAEDENGNPCMVSFPDRVRLASHYAHTRGGAHGKQILFRAQKHMTRAYEQ